MLAHSIFTQNIVIKFTFPSGIKCASMAYRGDKLKPEKVVELLRQKGITVSLDQATEILKFLRSMANTVVAQYLKRHE
jgi:hypothetical protein